MTRITAVTLAAALVATTIACTSSNDTTGEMLIFAAASLTESFTKIGAAFERATPGSRVRFNFGPSDGLATGIGEGARADVFASASQRWMDAVAASAGVTDRAVFARNDLVLIVPRDNPRRLREYAAVATGGVKLVLAAAAVPAGQYARESLAKAGLAAAERNVVSNEEDVKGVVSKIVLGEADAGIVYRTDVTTAVAETVSTIEIPAAVNVTASYTIAVVKGASPVATARAFVAFVLGRGQTILREAGFQPAS